MPKHPDRRDAKLIECGTSSHTEIWMKMQEESNKMGIINTFDMEKFFDKESLMDIMYALWKKAGIDEKDYRMW
mgnify:CR=1 FL=1